MQSPSLQERPRQIYLRMERLYVDVVVLSISLQVGDFGLRESSSTWQGGCARQWDWGIYLCIAVGGCGRGRRSEERFERFMNIATIRRRSDSDVVAMSSEPCTA